MMRLVLALAFVASVAACSRADEQPPQQTDTTQMQMQTDTTKMMDTSKATQDTTKRM
jgi:hypothetical protein